MAIRIKETRRSKARLSGPDPWEKREYKAWDPANPNVSPAAIEAAVTSFAPTVIGALPIQNYEQTPDEKHQGFFHCQLDYSKSAKREVPETGMEEIGWDLSPQTMRLKQSPHGNHFSKHAASGTAPDFKGGIGFESTTRRFEGVETYVEVFSFWITKYVPKATAISNSFTLGLRACAFKWNAAGFRGQSSGECLFYGAKGSPRNAKDHAVTYNFLSSMNATGLVVGDISGIVKQGHDYLWVLYEDVEDTDGKFIVQRPKAAYIERPYKSANFPVLLGLSA